MITNFTKMVLLALRTFSGGKLLLQPDPDIYKVYTHTHILKQKFKYLRK